MPVNAAINRAELKAALRKIEGLKEIVSVRQRKAMLRKGALILRDAARQNVPIAAEPYVIYKDGQPLMSILPGFVRDAVEVRNLRKSNDLFVGIAKLNTVLAYWATWLEFGATNRDGSKRAGFAFMRRAVESAQGAVIAQVVKDATALAQRVIKKLSIN